LVRKNKNGFKLTTISMLIRNGLAIATPQQMRAGGAAIEVVQCGSPTRAELPRNLIPHYVASPAQCTTTPDIVHQNAEFGRLSPRRINKKRTMRNYP